MAQTVNNLSAMRETQVLSLGWEDLLEEEMVITGNIHTQEGEMFGALGSRKRKI